MAVFADAVADAHGGLVNPLLWPRQPFESTSHVLINEFMPQPNATTTLAAAKTGFAGLPHDGEWVELFNPTAGTVNLAGFVLYDNNNIHALPITTANTNTGGTSIASLGYLVVYRDGDADFSLETAGGDTVRLFTAAIGSGGVLVDSHTYAASAAANKSFARIPDGSTNWIDPDPTPGEPNNYFFEPLPGGEGEPAFAPADNPPLIVVAENPVIKVDLGDENAPEAPSVPEAVIEERKDVKLEEPAVIEVVIGTSTPSGDDGPDPDAGASNSTTTDTGSSGGSPLNIPTSPAPEDASPSSVENVPSETTVPPETPPSADVAPNSTPIDSSAGTPPPAESNPVEPAA